MDQLVQHNNQQRSMIERFSEADAEQFSFRDLISKIFLRPKIFLLALLLPAIVSVWFVALVPQDWEASTKILIRYSKTDTGLLKGLVADAGTSLSGSTSAELIKSVPVLKATIKDVGINADDIYRKPLSVIVGKIAGPFKKWLGNEEKEQTHNESESSADKALLSAFKKSLDSSSKQSSKKSIQILDKHSQTSDTAKLDELISLNVKSYNREKVALMANGLSKAFIDHFYDLYAQAAHNQSVYLSTLVRDQETELNTVLRAKPSDFNSGKIDTHIRKSISRDTPMLRTITAQLNDTRNELRRVSQVYTHDTPKVKRLQALVSKLSFQLKKQELVEMHKQLLEQLKTRQFQAQNTEKYF